MGGLGELFDAYLAERCEPIYNIDPRKMASGAKLLALSPAEHVRLVRITLESDVDAGEIRGADEAYYRRTRRERLLAEVLRRSLPFTLEDAHAILALQAKAQADTPWVRHKRLVKSIARAAEAGGWLAALRPDLERLRSLYAEGRRAEIAECRKMAKELDLLLAQAAGKPKHEFALERCAWGEKAGAALEAMDAELRPRWQALLSYCAGAKGSAPSVSWLEAGEAPIGALGKERFAEIACEWLGLLAGPAPKRDASRAELGAFLVSEGNGDALKGMAWLLAHAPGEAAARVLGDAAAAAFRKVPGIGARSVKLGNACLHTLKGFPGLLGAAELARLRARVKLPSQLAAIGKALGECAARLGIGIAETEELATPDHGFAAGKRTLQFGEAAAELAIDGASVGVTWTKRGTAEERKLVKQLADDVEKTLAAVRQRLERAPLAQREWSFDTWRSRYLEHPVAGALARRLIWRFRGAAGERAACWIAGEWRDETGAVADVAGAAVLPWHPVFAAAESVRRWRALLSEHGVEQPFKQAHREIYLLTDAERGTRTYSNRFAAHVLRQHQFASLCAARGWDYRLLGGFDSDFTPTLELPQWGLSAEYWVQGTGDNADLTPAGIYLHVLTDQVRFVSMEGERAAPLALEDVPPLVFSEVMRDVDLFVGVSSVGNDPAWFDGGPQGRFAAYWGSYAWGELGAFGESRRDALAELLPRLTALRGIARIDGKFLRVKGRLREYKIHLGSGNILMEPNDQYLCIVPERSRDKGPRLPFDGDQVLSVILSKALLLARDDQIEDPTIARQIAQAGR